MTQREWLGEIADLMLTHPKYDVGFFVDGEQVSDYFWTVFEIVRVVVAEEVCTVDGEVFVDAPLDAKAALADEICPYEMSDRACKYAVDAAYLDIVKPAICVYLEAA